jgi:YebC/PmpR family DNA-binding regulatory protein
MSGHSKWATIKRKKGMIDAKRGKVFTKIIRELTISAKSGGGDPGANPRLRLAVSTAKAANMPSKNIDNAIAKGTGQLEGVVYEDCHYEGYAPGGVALYIDVVTDNKTRTVGEIRHILTRNGGTMAEPGSVAYLFQTKGIITVATKAVPEDKLLEVALEAGANDVVTEGEYFTVETSPEDFEKVKKAVAEANIPLESSEITKVPSQLVLLEGDKASKVLSMIELLEDNDDVQKVYANFDISQEEMEKIAK